jgi:hypothetical protein
MAKKPIELSGWGRGDRFDRGIFIIDLLKAII